MRHVNRPILQETTAEFVNPRRSTTRTTIVRLAIVACMSGTFAAIAFVSGCGTTIEATPTAELEGDAPGAAGSIDDSEVPGVLAAMESAFGGQQIETVQPATASRRGRWADVFDAVTVAFDEPGVVAIAMTSELIDDRQWIIDFTLTDDRRGRLIIDRTFDDQVYRSSVTLGRLDLDDPVKRRMLRAIDRQMKAFGTKRSFRNDD